MTEPIAGAGGAPSVATDHEGGANGAPGVLATPPRGDAVLIGDILLECVPELGKGALLLTVSSVAATPLAIAGAVVAGIDIAQCMSDEMAEASEAAAIRRAVEECSARDGIPATAGEQTTCLIVENEP